MITAPAAAARGRREVDISADDAITPVPHPAPGAGPDEQHAPGRAPRRHAVLSGLWTGITYGVLALVLLLATLVIVVPRLVGGIPLTILSGSMEPNLPVGSLAVVRPVDPAEIRIGDIVTYLPNPEDPTAVTHRVVAIDTHQDGTRTFTLQGDANASPDAPVQEHQVRGTVAYAVPWLGHVNSAVNGEQRAMAVYVVAGALFLWAVVLWWRAWRRRARAAAPDSPVAASADERPPV
ncbi:signal peptidase I [Cellulosimicrobium sp. PMB13]|uniref:signal peptidase I n=1 Tax=Cellulosimicrobium sp. PMB13 TaxID=3120158 RepID=UPI003F4C7AC5